MLERLKRRGGSINLIVHESKINQTIRELEYSGRNPEYLAALKEVSQEIKGVKKSPDTGFVAVEHYEPRRIGDDIGRAGHVTLFGCHRRACLKWAGEAARKAGASVTISEKGSI